MYKLIHNLKLGKDLKDAIGEHVSEDPITDAENEVKAWAKDKKRDRAVKITRKNSVENFYPTFLMNSKRRYLLPKVTLKPCKMALWKKIWKWPRTS
jgi:two-component system phosphate regulon sensor histidine kinase PhoR